MNSLAPFLSNNRCLRQITLSNCNIGADASIDMLANTLMNREDNTLERLNLDGNNFGACNLDGLVTSLLTFTKLGSLSIKINGIGQRMCASLAQLLKSPKSNLEYLYLSNNLIDDKDVDILTDSLTKNTKLRALDLYKNNITGTSWLSLLKLVCNTSSMTAVKESNHTLNCLWIYGDEMKAKVISTLGVDKANLLIASLELNEKWSWKDNNSSIIRQKMIWAHGTGDLNIAVSAVPDGVMPVILSWFGDISNEKNANLIRYHTPPLSQEVVNTKRLDSLYRIVRERPPVLCQNRQPSVDNVSELTDTLACASLG